MGYYSRQAKVAKLLAQDRNKGLTDLGGLVVGLEVVTLLVAGVTANRADVHHAVAELDKGAALDGNIEIGNVVQAEVGKILPLVLANPLDEAVRGELLAELEGSQAVLREAVVEERGDGDAGGDDERDHAFLGRRGLGIPNLGAFGGPGGGGDGAGAEEILVPRDPEQLRRFLEIMTEQGAPPEVLRLIAQGIAEDAGFANDVDVEAEFGNILGDPVGDDEHVPAEEGDDGSQGEDGEGLGGRLRDGSAALFDLLNHLVPAFHTPWSAESGGPRIPGGFPEDDTDTDDEMPPLIPQSDAAPDGEGGGDGTDSDDEMPPLVPPSNSEPRGSGGNERGTSGGGDGGGSDDDMPGLLPP